MNEQRERGRFRLSCLHCAAALGVVELMHDNDVAAIRTHLQNVHPAIRLSEPFGISEALRQVKVEKVSGP